MILNAQHCFQGANATKESCRVIYTKKSKEEHQFYVSKIGNMTLLSGKKNISASNNPFNSKREIYKESDFKLTQQLTKLDDFNFLNVTDRSKILAKESVEIWSF